MFKYLMGLLITKAEKGVDMENLIIFFYYFFLISKNHNAIVLNDF